MSSWAAETNRRSSAASGRSDRPSGLLVLTKCVMNRPGGGGGGGVGGRAWSFVNSSIDKSLVV